MEGDVEVKSVLRVDNIGNKAASNMFKTAKKSLKKQKDRKVAFCVVSTQGNDLVSLYAFSIWESTVYWHRVYDYSDWGVSYES